MALGTVSWDFHTTFSVPIPVSPSVGTHDIVTIPSGLAPGSANVLIMQCSFYDPLKIVQAARFDTVPSSFISLAPTTSPEVNVLSAGSGLVIATDLSNQIYGGDMSSGMQPVFEGPGLFDAPPGSLNSGVTIRFKGSAKSQSVTAKCSFAAILITASGAFNESLNSYARQLASKSFFPVAPTTWSSSISTVSPDTENDVAYFCGYGEVAIDAVSISAPTFGPQPPWRSVAAANDLAWSVVGYLPTPDPSGSTGFSMFIPSQSSGFPNVIGIYTPIATGKSRSFATFIG